MRLIGILLAKIFHLIAGFFRLFFKIFFYKILVKIYYQIFRLKKTYLLHKSPIELIKSQTVYFFIFGLCFVLIFINILSWNQASAMETKIHKTVMANLIQSEFSSLENEELIEEISTPNSLLMAGKEKYLDNSCTVNKEDALVTGGTQEDLNLLALNNSGDVILKPKIISTEILGGGVIPQRTEIVYHAVQIGDTVSTIARKFNISINTILWANNLSAFSLIRPGDKLMILPYSGIMYTVKSGDTVSKIAKTYKIEENKILSCNDLASGLKAGQKIILPGASKITTVATPKTSYTGISAITNLAKAPGASDSGDKMLWPTVGHRITQYYSWRHTGVDIGNKTGTPLYAADAGTVEFAGWNTGYGYNIVINHGGGIKTRYAHASKLFVKAGDQVDRGENIAAMGSTGWSTGPHIHFEVIIGGKKYNPLNYIK